MKNKKVAVKKQAEAPALFADFFAEAEKKTQKELSKSAPAQDPQAKKNRQFSTMADLLARHQAPEKNKYVSQEFQSFGCYLAGELNDRKHVSLYIKLAKTVSRGLLERALSFVSDATNAKSLPRLFMWKLGQLKKESQAKKDKV